MLPPHRIDFDLELRWLELQYAEALYAIVERDREYLRRWQNWPDKIHSVRDMRHVIQYSMQKRQQNTGMDWVIFCQGAPVGKVGLVRIDWPEEAEIGYWLAKKYQRRGLMTRSVRAVTGYALGSLHLRQVEIRCAEGNTRSRAIPERLGFAYVGASPSATHVNGQPIVDAVYVMAARHWYPQMIYHIAVRRDWEHSRWRGEYRPPSLAAQGFIHFSQIQQIIPVANAIYAGQTDLVLLCVDPERVRVPLKFEPPDTGIHASPPEGEELFPHLYGPLEATAVVNVFDFPPNGNGGFSLPGELPK